VILKKRVDELKTRIWSKKNNFFCYNYEDVSDFRSAILLISIVIKIVIKAIFITILLYNLKFKNEQKD